MADYHSPILITPPGSGKKMHFVHVYAVVRVKLEVEAQSHEHAMTEADRLLFSNGFGVRLSPETSGIVDAEYAEEIIGYLVDEVDDPDYVQTRSYGPGHEPQLSEHRRDLSTENAGT